MKNTNCLQQQEELRLNKKNQETKKSIETKGQAQLGSTLGQSLLDEEIATINTPEVAQKVQASNGKFYY